MPPNSTRLDRRLFAHIAAALIPLAALAFLLSYSDLERRSQDEHRRFLDYARLIGQSSAKAIARAEGYASALTSLDPQALGECRRVFSAMREDLIEATELTIFRGEATICAIGLGEDGKMIQRQLDAPSEAVTGPAAKTITISRTNEANGTRIDIGLRPQTLLIAPITATAATNIGFALVDKNSAVLASHVYEENDIGSFLQVVGETRADGADFSESDSGWFIGSSVLPGTEYRVVTASRPSEHRLELWLTVLRALLPPLILLAVVFVVLRYGIQRFLLRYLSHIYSTFRQYGTGNTRARVGQLAAAPPEIDLLGVTFDMMADRIERRTHDTEAALAEQRRLSRELHHRIKNTLQMIISLVSMQRRDATGPREKAALRVTLERILAISAAYRVSYASTEGTNVALTALVHEVVEALRGPALLPQGRVRIQTNAGANAAEIDLDRAIPLAFILAELLPPRFDCLLPGEVLTIELTGADRIAMVISGASQINDTLDGNETGTPASLRSRLVHAYLHQLDATCGMEDAMARLEIPLHPVPGPQASASMH
ncbi:sensor histidine kinase [Stappia sp. 28M-7]|uniref:sensor histidine kinase n=1 Tax=Stappia sp. 28M-7 TaxID=2762596 RepID=UPI000E736F10|nr:sensor histidine kinase [Stappia sp. 28M-7]MBC2860843.1 sensor histidine kinase [Stappia sp. 28M-7]